MFWLFQMIVILVLVMLLFAVGIGEPDSLTGEPEISFSGGLVIAMIGLFVLATLVPSIAVAVRRFHDQDKSGWMYLLSLIPYAGGIILFIFMLLPGTDGENRFGSDPKMAENVDDVFT